MIFIWFFHRCLLVSWPIFQLHASFDRNFRIQTKSCMFCDISNSPIALAKSWTAERCFYMFLKGKASFWLHRCTFYNDLDLEQYNWYFHRRDNSAYSYLLIYSQFLFFTLCRFKSYHAFKSQKNKKVETNVFVAELKCLLRTPVRQ